MKRTHFFLALILALLTFAGCGSRYTEYWKNYDEVKPRTYPSDTASEAHDGGHGYHPVEITEKDETGQWGGEVVSNQLFRKKEIAWYPLEQLVYAGTDDPKEQLETYIVKPDSLTLYKHPKEVKQDVVSLKLYKDDTVQVTARSFSWVHIRKIRYSRTEAQSNIYGWVKESNLQPIDPISYKVLDKVEAKKAVLKDAQTMEERYSKLMSKVHPVYRKLCIWLSWVALGLIVLLIVPAFFRSKILHLLWMLPIFILLTGCGEGFIMPNCFFVFAIPFMVYVISYPFLYFRTALAHNYIMKILSVVAAVFYLVLWVSFPHHSGLSLIWRVLALLVLSFLVYIEAGLLAKRINDDICPSCGYFARHEKGSWVETGTDVSYGTGTEKVYDRTTTEIRGNTKYITDHYHNETYRTTTRTTHYRRERECMNCGCTYYNYKSRSITTRS